MKTNYLFAAGIAIVLSLTVGYDAYGDVRINGQTVSEDSYEGDIKSTEANSAVSVSNGDKVTITGNIDQDKDDKGEYIDREETAVTVSGKDSEITVKGNITSEGKGVSVNEGSASVEGDIKAVSKGIENERGDVKVKGDVSVDHTDTENEIGRYSEKAIDNKEGTVKVDGNVSSKGIDDIRFHHGTTVNNTGGSVEINGDIKSEGDRLHTTAVFNEDGTVTVKGNIESSGVSINNRNGNVTVEGDITSKADVLHNYKGDTTIKGNVSGSGFRPTYQGMLSNGDGNVHVEGNLNVVSGCGIDNNNGNMTIDGDYNSIDSTGTRMDNYDSNLTINGNINGRTTIKNHDGNITINGNADNTSVRNSSGEVIINGDMKEDAPDVYAIDNETGKVEVNGSVESNTRAISNIDGSVIVNGDVTMTEEPEEYTNDNRISQWEYYKRSRGGNYSPASGYSGIRNEEGNIEVKGNVSSNGKSYAALEGHSQGTITIDGNVEVNEKSAALLTDGASLTVKGNMTSTNEGIVMDYTSNAVIQGDLSAGGNGIRVEILPDLPREKENDEKKKKGMVIVDGTIRSPSGTAVIVQTKKGQTDEEVIEQMPTIIVYQLEGTGEKPFVGVEGTDWKSRQQKNITEKEKAVASQINYIIRRADSKNASFDLENTRMLGGYETGRENETIVINVSTAEGYTVSGINGGQAVAKKRSDGVWELTVPEGGGVTISVLVKAIAEAEKEGVTERVISGGSSKAETSSDYVLDKVAVSSQGALTDGWNADGSFTINGMKAMGQWMKIYVKEADTAAWFYFDENGNRLTGWQLIRGADGRRRWYYLNPKPGALQGACYINARTPDGYRVNKDGAWIKDGVVQEADN